MLIEDTISVGDVVVAGGHSGVVEDISIRILRLRDLEGSVHTVPFGNVTSVTNMTKDFSFAVIDVSVARREDPDHVATVLCAIGAALQAGPAHGPPFTEPLELPTMST